MNFSKQEIIKMSGEDESKIDYARPIHFDNEMRTGWAIDPQGFVWSYETARDGEQDKFGSLSGKPVHIGEYLIKAIENNQFIPIGLVESAIRMAANKEMSPDKLIEILKSL